MSMVMLHSPQIMYLTRDIKTSCTLLGTVAIYQRPVVAGGGFFLLLDLGPGAAACGMWIDTLGTVASYQRHVVAGGGFFLLLNLGPGAAACGMGIEINTGYSCYLK